jgi:subtilisin
VSGADQQTELNGRDYGAPFRDQPPPAAREQLPLAQLTPTWAWGGSTGVGVRVAILDSGIDADHPAVGGVNGYLALRDENGAIAYDDAPHGDAYGHGTACAGLIRALAPDCELYSVQVLGERLTGKGTVLAAGLRWAIDQRMDICNLSLGTTRREFFAALHELADLAYFRRVMLVAAANNMPVPAYPSVFASVIAVAAYAGDDPTQFYYNPDPPVEFGAAGIDQRVAWRDGGWLNASGNSFAAPQITGLVARILAKHPGLDLSQVKVILRALAANGRSG